MNIFILTSLTKQLIANLLKHLSEISSYSHIVFKSDKLYNIFSKVMMRVLLDWRFRLNLFFELMENDFTNLSFIKLFQDLIGFLFGDIESP